MSFSVNPCMSAPCQNGGTCYRGDNGYTCQCLSTHTGTNCETLGKNDILVIVPLELYFENFIMLGGKAVNYLPSYDH